MRRIAPPTEIDRIEAPTRERFERDYADYNRPVVMTGIVDKWPAMKWNFDYLREVAGDTIVRTRYDSDGDHLNYYTPTGGKTREIAFGDYLDGLVADPPDTQHYLSQYDVSAVSPKLCEGLDYGRYPAGALSVFFIGRGTYSPNHHHGHAEAALCQISGRKLVKLYPPHQSRCMYPYPWYSPLTNFSRVDDRVPDLARFPRFRDARSLTVELQPGEMLFIPVHWWHSIETPDLAVSVTFFWASQRRRYHFPSPGLQMYAHSWFSPFAVKGKLSRVMKKLSNRSGGCIPAAGGQLP